MGSKHIQRFHRLSIPNVRPSISGTTASHSKHHSTGKILTSFSFRIVAIILAFICFLLLATFPGWHEETDEHGSEHDVKPFPSRPVSQVALALIFVASVFVLVSVLWQHTASVGASTIAQDLGNGSVVSGVGTTAMILGWFGFSLFIIVTIGLLVMILSISLLDKLTDDE